MNKKEICALTFLLQFMNDGFLNKLEEINKRLEKLETIIDTMRK